MIHVALIILLGMILASVAWGIRGLEPTTKFENA